PCASSRSIGSSGLLVGRPGWIAGEVALLRRWRWWRGREDLGLDPMQRGGAEKRAQGGPERARQPLVVEELLVGGVERVCGGEHGEDLGVTNFLVRVALVDEVGERLDPDRVDDVDADRALEAIDHRAKRGVLHVGTLEAIAVADQVP